MTRRLLTLCLSLSLLWPSLVLAVSVQSVTPGTPIGFGDTGGTAWTLSNRGAGTGQISDRVDLGATHAAWWELRCALSLNGTHTLGAQIEYWVITSDGTSADGGLGTTNAAVASADVRRGLTLMAGALSVYQTTNLTTMIASWRNLYIPSRYASLFMWNATAIPTETSTTKHKCWLTPMPFQQS